MENKIKITTLNRQPNTDNVEWKDIEIDIASVIGLSKQSRRIFNRNGSFKKFGFTYSITYLDSTNQAIYTNFYSRTAKDSDYNKIVNLIKNIKNFECTKYTEEQYKNNSIRKAVNYTFRKKGI
jgi:hypothetical protein